MKMRKEFVVIGLHIDRAHGGQRVSFESVEKLPPAVPAPGDDPLDSHMRSRGEFFELTVPTPHEFHMGAHVYVDVVNVSDADADATAFAAAGVTAKSIAATPARAEDGAK